MTLIWFKGCRMIRSEKRLKQCDNAFQKGCENEFLVKPLAYLNA